MGAKTDQVKGHIKEAAGIIAGDEDLEAEGTADRHAGKAKEKLNQATDKLKDVIDQARGKGEEAVAKANDALHRK